MENTNNILTGLVVTAQVPLDAKTYVIDEATLMDLGPSDNLAYTYHKGLEVTAITERTKWEWKEIEVGDTGLLPSNFTYPNGLIVNGVDYSNKQYNFVQITTSIPPEPEVPPLQVIDEGNGEGIIIRGRDPLNYGPIGFRAIDFSKSDFPSTDYGAKADYSFIGNGVFQIIGSDADYAFIGGGRGNEIQAQYAFIGGGTANIISQFGEGSVIGGGEGNSIIDGVSPVGGNNGILSGSNHLINGLRCGILAGTNLRILNTSQNSAFGAGENGTIEGNRAFIGGGYFNKALKSNTGILGGANNETRGIGSQSMGNSAIADSFEEIALGSYGTTYTAANTDDYDVSDRQLNVGIGSEIGGTKDGFSIFKSGLVTMPSSTIGLIAAGSGKSVVSKEYLNSVLPVVSSTQKVLNYPADFTAGVYTLIAADNDKLLIINNGSNTVTIRIPIGLPSEFFVAAIQEGSADITVQADGTSLFSNTGGFKIASQYSQIALDKKTTTETFFLTGNTKV